MSNEKLNALLSASLKSSVALLPLAFACAQMPASAQTPAASPAPAAKKTQAELDAEAAAAQAAAAEGDAAAADDAKAAASAGGAVGKDIVVTGTSIRGAAPTGTNLITIGADDVQASGAAGGQQLLATIPQITGNFFNGIPQSESINQLATPTVAQSTNKPTLRPVPTTGGSNDTGNSTLILLDGLRTSGIGVNGLSANPDAVPPALLEKVELNPDGGSSVYGSDAIGGVINYVTRRKFDGLLLSGRYGFADQYKTYDGNIVVGKDWGSGSAYISYSYAHSDPVFNRDRSWVRPLDWGTRLQTGLNCDNPNVRVAAAGTTPLHYYAVAGGVPATTSFTVIAPVTGTPNLCSLGLNATLASANTRHNVLFNFSQDLTDTIKIATRVRYSKNFQAGVITPTTFTGTINNTNPFFRTLAAPDNALTSYAVLGNFRPALGDQKEYSNGSTQYGATAELTWDIDSNWQFRGVANYDRSRSTYSNPTYNPTAINNGFNGTATTSCSLTPSAATCWNPFNIAASNPALLANLINWQDIGRGRDKILNFKGTVDGALFELPGGKLRVALGVEYLKDTFAKGQSQALPGTAINFFSVSQTNKSIFAEANIPVVSSANAMPLLRELRLSASGRYDKYSGISGVFNPRFGTSYKPVNWLTLRGTWGKTFRAPTPPDLVGTSKLNTTINTTPSCVFFCFLVDPARPIPSGITNNALSLILNGTQPGVKPQKGINWSVAAEVTPFTGFRASLSYYSIDYIGTLANPANGNPVFPSLAFIATICPQLNGVGNCSQAQIDAFAAQAINPTAIAAVDRTQIYGLYDIRRTNLGITKTGGLDYSVRYTRRTGFGSVYAGISGSVILENRTSATPGAPFISTIGRGTTAVSQAGGSLHRATAQAGFTWGGLKGQVILNHTDGYPVNPSATVFQSKVKAFNVVNTFFSYDFQGDSFLEKGLQLSLTINNILNEAPPLFMSNGSNGYTNGSTLGRVVMFGVQKKF